MEWYALSKKEIFEQLLANEEGLVEAEVRRRALQYGQNALPAAKRRSLVGVFFSQFLSPVIYILLVAAGIVFAMGDIPDALIILTVLTVNAVVGSIQEGKAQNTLFALQQMVKTNASVLRDGREEIIPDYEVVPGDILLLREGDKIAADARIIEDHFFRIDESSLTGESDPAAKHSNIIVGENLTAADQRNMVFKGTYVVGGEGRAVVVATGTATFLGSISAKLVHLDTEIPLKKAIRTLSRAIIAVILIVAVCIFILGVSRGAPANEMFVIVVAIVVSAIPEGLPVVVTVILAMGMYRMSKRHALVKKMQAVEALGRANVIAVDKTGTVTMNQMMVEAVYVDGDMFTVGGSGYNPSGEILKKKHVIDPAIHTGLVMAANISVLTSSSVVAYDEKKELWQRISGDPTEAALRVFGEKIGVTKEKLEREYEKLLELPFNSAIKYHAVAHRYQGDITLSVAGAPEMILHAAKHIWRNGKAVPYHEADKAADERVLHGMMRNGLRVLGLAVRLKFPPGEMIEGLPELCFVGFAGMSDTIRSGVLQAVRDAHQAGVRVVMITGDHVETAQAIATRIGIFSRGDVVLTGEELATLSPAALADRLASVSVFARVAPEDKLTIIEAYRRRGEIVAMTGDGVNDVLSLAAADLGVAMGRIGTEAAKEAADIILLDDNFGSIVAAIEEGRAIYRTIKKVILYLFSTSIGELATIIVAMASGYPLPLLASQIIWLNFVTDGFLVVPLGLESGTRDGRERRLPHHSAAGLVDRTAVIRMVLVGMTMMIGTIIIFLLYLPQGYVLASTVALTLLAVFQWGNAWNCRSGYYSIFSRKMGISKPLLFATFCAALLQVAAVYVPFLQDILRTVPLQLRDWLIILAFGTMVIITEEIRKLIVRALPPATR